MKWVKTNLKKLTLINPSQHEKLVTPLIRVMIILIIPPNLQPKSLDRTNQREKIKKSQSLFKKKSSTHINFSNS